MSFSFDPDIVGLFQTAHVIVRVLLTVAVIGLVVWAIRKPRGEPVPTADDDSDEVWRLVDGMEARLETLERLLAERSEQRETNHLPADEGRTSGRTS